MNTFLILAVAIEAAIVAAFALAWRTTRRARRAATACDFPGCHEARLDLERLAAQHEAIPRQKVLDVVEGVRAHERRND